MSGGLTLDTGALIGFEKRKRRVIQLVKMARMRGVKLAVPAGVIARAWRDGTRQARLAWLLGSDVIETVPLTGVEARLVGKMCGLTGADEVVDVSVVVCARRRGHSVLTSDATELRRIDPDLRLLSV